MKTICRCACLFVISSYAAAVAKSAPFQWPDSSTYWRALVNVNQYIQKYMQMHPQWFEHDKLVTDLAVQDVQNHDQAVHTYQGVRALLESHGMYVGTYTSGTAVRARTANTNYPPRNVSTEDMPASTKYAGTWPGHPELQFLDLSDANTRRAFHENLRKIWQDTPAPIRFVDNAAIHSSAGKGQAWEAYMKNIEEIRQLGDSMGSHVIVNISMHAGMLSDQELAQLLHAIGTGNGICVEMPWARSIRENPSATQRQQQRYRQLLDSGLAIVMIPVAIPQDQLASWLRSWKKIADHLYLATPFFKEPDMSILSSR
jgi:hypothetical protein